MDTTATGVTEKRVLLVFPGSDGKDHKEVVLTPGVTVKDALESAGLRGFALRDPAGGNYPWNTNLYAAVENGQKLEAAKDDVTAG